MFPALVEPGAPLSHDELLRYSRHLLLPGLGEIAQRRLRAARVAVIGAGGLGSAVLPYLVAAGVGSITIVDDDRVEESNLQRQVIHDATAIGELKVESAVRSLRELDPGVSIDARAVRLTPENVDEIVAGHHLVVDGSDNFATRYLIDDVCARFGMPDVWGSVLQMEGMVSVFWAAHGPRYTDLHAAAPPEGSVPSCAEGGVLGALCGIVGTMMATQAVLLICGVGRPLVGRVVIHDALDGESRTIPLARRPPRAKATRSVPAAPSGEENAAAATGELRTISAAELAALLDSGDPLLLDVRGPDERAIARIDRAVPMSADDLVRSIQDGRLPADRTVIVHCRSGARSSAAIGAAAAAGRTDLINLEGGILAWIDDVDPTLVRY